MFAVRGMVVLVWIFAIPRVISNDSEFGPTLSSGTFVAFLLYMTLFINPIDIIGQMARIMNRATSSAHRIFEVLDTEPQIVDAPRAVRLDPDHEEARSNLGAAYAGQGRLGEAVAQFEAALRLDPGDPEALENLRRVKAALEGIDY